MKITKTTNPNFKFSMIKKPEKSQKVKRKFASQTLSKKAKFVVFGLKKAKIATLLQNLQHKMHAICILFVGVL